MGNHDSRQYQERVARHLPCDSTQVCSAIFGGVRVPIQSSLRPARHHSEACLRGASDSADAGTATQIALSLSGNQVAVCFGYDPYYTPLSWTARRSVIRRTILGLDRLESGRPEERPGGPEDAARTIWPVIAALAGVRVLDGGAAGARGAGGARAADAAPAGRRLPDAAGARVAGGLVRVVVRHPRRRAAGGRAPAPALGAVAAAGADPRRGGGPRGGRRLGVGDLRRRRVRPGGPRLLQALGGPARSGAPPLAHVPARPSGPLAARACRRPARHAAAAALLPRMAHGAGVGRPLARPGGAGLGRAPVDLGRRRPRRAAVHPAAAGGSSSSPSPYSSSSAE